MLDSPTASLFMGVLVLISTLAGLLIAGRWQRSASILLCLTLPAIIAVQSSSQTSLFWAVALPWAGYAIWMAIAAPLLGFAAGLMTHVCAIPKRRRLMMSAGLVLVAIMLIAVPDLKAAWFPIVSWQPAGWRNGVCLQSTEVTCCPAAASTFLRKHNIELTERTLAGYCNTTGAGTDLVGVYAGLCKASEGTRYRVKVHTGSFAEIIQPQRAPERLPALALIRFRDRPNSSAVRLFGDSRGEGHAIVLLRRYEDGSFAIADPATGLQRWTLEQLQERWSGPAFSLVESAR